MTPETTEIPLADALGIAAQFDPDQLRFLRQEVEARVDRLIDFLNAMDPFVVDEREAEDDHDELDVSEGEDLEGDELDKGEASDLEIYGEGDSDNGCGTVDDEPSLGCLDGRMNQTKWGKACPDYVPRGVHSVYIDAEYDPADFESDILDKLEGPEDTGIGDIDGLMEQTRYFNSPTVWVE